MSDDFTIRRLAEKIAIDFNKSIQERTDQLLELDAIQYQNLGIDSKLVEKKKVKSDSKYIYKQIKGIDEKLGTDLISHMDA